MSAMEFEIKAEHAVRELRAKLEHMLEHGTLWGTVTVRKGQAWSGLIVDEDDDAVWMWQPAIDGDEMHAGSPAILLRLPWRGPMFVRFAQESEAEVRATLVQQRHQRPYAARAVVAIDWMTALPVPCEIRSVRDEYTEDRRYVARGLTTVDEQQRLNVDGPRGYLSYHDIVNSWPWTVTPLLQEQDAPEAGAEGYARDLDGVP